MGYDPTGSRCYGDDALIDLEPYMKDALENVVDVIMRYGEWPNPWERGRGSRKLFDLYDWMHECMHHEMGEFTFALTLDSDPVLDSQMLEAWREKIRWRLMNKLADSEMVLDEAERLREIAD